MLYHLMNAMASVYRGSEVNIATTQHASTKTNFWQLLWGWTPGGHGRPGGVVGSASAGRFKCQLLVQTPDNNLLFCGCPPPSNWCHSYRKCS